MVVETSTVTELSTALMPQPVLSRRLAPGGP
jgi:hypothetical protein